jgi:hypothetical protein
MNSPDPVYFPFWMRVAFTFFMALAALGLSAMIAVR